MNVVKGAALGVAIAVGAWACPAQELSQTVQHSRYMCMRSNPELVDDNSGATVYMDSRAGSALVGEGIPFPTTRIGVARSQKSSLLLLNGIHLGVAIFDLQMTQRCIVDHRCHEINPVLPSSYRRQLSVNLGIVTYTAGMSYWLQRHKSRLWWLPPSAGIVFHSIGVSTGLKHQ